MGVFLGRWSLRPRWSAASAASASRITPTARRRSGARTGTPCGTSTPSRTRAGWGWRSAWRQASGPRAISGAWRRAHGTDPRRRPDDLEVPLAVPGRLPAELDPRRRGARPGRGRDLVHGLDLLARGSLARVRGRAGGRVRPAAGRVWPDLLAPLAGPRGAGRAAARRPGAVRGVGAVLEDRERGYGGGGPGGARRDGAGDHSHVRVSRVA